MIYYPPHLRFALVLHLFVFPVFLPLCFASLSAGNLYPFEVMTSRFVIKQNLLREGLAVMYCTDYRARVTACVRGETRDWKWESSNPVYPRLLLSKHRGHSRTIVFCQRDKHGICILNFWLSLPGTKKYIGELPMNANFKQFHGGPTSWLEQILSSKQSGQGKL